MTDQYKLSTHRLGDKTGFNDPGVASLAQVESIMNEIGKIWSLKETHVIDGDQTLLCVWEKKAFP